MLYFIPADKGDFKKGEKVKIILRIMDLGTNKFEDEILEEFTINEFLYVNEPGYFVLKSPNNYSLEKIQSKLNSGYLVAIKELKV